MKNIAIALATTAAFTGSAFAADMTVKVPPPAPVVQQFSWTGCYLGGGAGYGMWNQEITPFMGPPTSDTTTQFSASSTAGGRGWFGTVGGGCDYQFGLGAGIPGINQIVIGAFADYDFGSLKGSPSLFTEFTGTEKESSTWFAGGRIGWLVTPQVLTYVSGGWTQTRFDQFSQVAAFGALGQPDPGTAVLAHTYNGWFLGTGLEYATNWLPGLFWKTEYRFSDYNTDRLAIVCVVSSAACGQTVGVGPTGLSFDSQKFVQTIRTELVYHFNWGGPAIAKY